MIKINYEKFDGYNKLLFKILYYIHVIELDHYNIFI